MYSFWLGRVPAIQHHCHAHHGRPAIRAGNCVPSVYISLLGRHIYVVVPSSVFVWKNVSPYLPKVEFGWVGIVGGGVELGPLGTAATNRPVVPAPGDCDEGEISGMMIGRENWSTRRKPAPVPLCPPQNPHAARTRTRAAAVGNQRVTAWATARPRLAESMRGFIISCFLNEIPFKLYNFGTWHCHWRETFLAIFWQLPPF
jgi:hypothetical protein